ncbi:MAG: methylglyoxal synthase [Egibacteraceae bacterium]
MKEIDIDDALAPEGLAVRAKKRRRRNGARLRIVLLASEDCKDVLARFVMRHRDFFSRQELIATSGTSTAVRAQAELPVASVGHGPEGGDIVLANAILTGEIDAVVFLRSGMEVHAHEDDIRMLLRVCNMTNCVLATNIATAELVVVMLASSINCTAIDGA